MRIQNFVPMLALLALPVAAQAQARVEADGSAAASASRSGATAEARSSGRVELARESLVREGKGEKRVEPSRSETLAGAAALEAGASVTDLATIRDAAPEGRDLTASLSALAEMRGEGESAGRAAASIAARLRSGASDRAITSLASQGSAAADLRGAATLGGGAGAGLGSGVSVGLGVVGSLGGGIIR